MQSDENQRRVYDFFIDHLESKKPFTKDELQNVTTWQGDTFPTYWSKQFKPFVIEIGKNQPKQYRVSEFFRRYANWEKFQQHVVTQVRRLNSTDYKELVYNKIRIYEFFMPLTNETYLRATLDALFYKDTIEARLRTIGNTTIQTVFPRDELESEQSFIERVCAWLSNKFGGYSIYHVNGRFRAQPLTTRAEAGAGMSRYLVDETTAVTRFIFPCQDDNEAKLVEFFFFHLFVQAIIEAVNGEDEIWMVETGMENKLHIWRVSDS